MALEITFGVDCLWSMRGQPPGLLFYTLLQLSPLLYGVCGHRVHIYTAVFEFIFGVDCGRNSQGQPLDLVGYIVYIITPGSAAV